MNADFIFWELMIMIVIVLCLIGLVYFLLGCEIEKHNKKDKSEEYE